VAGDVCFLLGIVCVSAGFRERWNKWYFGVLAIIVGVVLLKGFVKLVRHGAKSLDPSIGQIKDTTLTPDDPSVLAQCAGTGCALFCGAGVEKFTFGAIRDASDAWKYASLGLNPAHPAKMLWGNCWM
jgi:hypothetical protein